MVLQPLVGTRIRLPAPWDSAGRITGLAESASLLNAVWDSAPGKVVQHGVPQVMRWMKGWGDSRWLSILDLEGRGTAR